MAELGWKRERIDLGLQLFRLRSGALHESLQVIRVLKLIKRRELVVEPPQRHQLGVLSRRWLGQSFDFCRRHARRVIRLDDTRVDR